MSYLNLINMITNIFGYHFYRQQEKDWEFIIKHKKKRMFNLLTNYKTPVFIIDSGIIFNRYQMLKEVLKQRNTSNIIAYSFKTNYEVILNKILKPQDVWAEVASGKEYQLAKAMGFTNNIIFNGPYKTQEQIVNALIDSSIIHIDNNEEINRVIKISKTIKKKTIDIGIRVRCLIPNRTESRFGFLIDNGEAANAVTKLSQNGCININSIQMHLGSDIDNPAVYSYALKSVAKFINNIQQKFSLNLKYIDVGGGYPASGSIPYHRKLWLPRSINKYILVITKQLKKILDQNIILVLEPGRFLVDDAEIFISKVIDRKFTHGKQTILVDGAISMLPLATYRHQIIRAYSPSLNLKEDNMINSVVYGSTCKEDDCLFVGQIPSISIDDYLVFFITGAYNQSLGSEFIFPKPQTHIL
jgi:diaminopimelate decarboxylase